jgi:hypothetical protein
MMQVCCDHRNVLCTFSSCQQSDRTCFTLLKPKLTNQQVPLQLVAVAGVARAVAVVAVAVVLDAAATTAAAPQGGSLTGMMALAGGE